MASGQSESVFMIQPAKQQAIAQHAAKKILLVGLRLEVARERLVAS